VIDSPSRSRFWRAPPVRIVIFFIAILGSTRVIQFAARTIGITGIPIGNILMLLLMASTALAVYLTLVQQLEDRQATELSPTRALHELLAGALLGAALISIVMLALWLLGVARFSWNGQVLSVATAGIAMALSTAMIEELLMRGVVFRIIEQWLGTGVALVVSAVLFGGLHAFNPGATFFNCAAIALEGGVLLAAAYMYTRRLWLPIGLHMGWNFFEGNFYGANLSGISAPSIYHGQFAGNELLTGGRFGPEASVVAMLVCVIAGVWILLRASRLRRPSNIN
jgi:membrane protease YdiL (CAAX protease family)